MTLATAPARPPGPKNANMLLGVLPRFRTDFLIGIPAAVIVLLLGRARCLSRGGCCWGAPDERQRHE